AVKRHEGQFSLSIEVVMIGPLVIVHGAIELEALLVGHNNAESGRDGGDLGGSLAEEFAVGVDVHGTLRFDAGVPKLEIFDFFQFEMRAEEDDRKNCRNLQLGQMTYEAKVEIAIGHVSLRRDPQSATITSAVCKRYERGSFIEGALVSMNSDLLRIPVQQRREERENISSIGAKKTRQPIRAPVDVGIQSEIGDVAEEVIRLPGF